MNTKKNSTYFNPLYPTLHIPSPNKIRSAIKIKPSFAEYIDPDINFTPYINFIEHIITNILPKDILEDLEYTSSQPFIRKTLLRLYHQLPLIIWNLPNQIPGLIHINILCPAEFTYGVGKFSCDTLSRWLIPGKPLPITCSPSLHFYFTSDPHQSYFLQQVILKISSHADFINIKNRLPALTREIRQTILAVQQTRNIASKKHLNSKQKKTLIQENLKNLLIHPTKDFETNLYEQIHQLLLKTSTEEKIQQINKKIQKFVTQKPRLFTQDIFQEIQHFVFILSNQFSAIREVNHITQLIAFQYLFRKALKSNKPKVPRKILFKLLKTHLHVTQKIQPVLGVIIGINTLKDSEIFDMHHIFQALQNSLCSIKFVKNSYLIDQRSEDKIRIFYLEIEKEDRSLFSLKEIQKLRKNLPKELKANIENRTHTLFMPRNEEEIMRNILILSKELKYIRDIPQAIISFDNQTETHLNFTIILLRVTHSKTSRLEHILETSPSFINFTNFDVKPLVKMRKNYQKEANIFTAKIDKKKFLRKDYCLDLFKARQTVSENLFQLIGEIRDFNGGILCKQQETFQTLQNLLSPINSKQKDNYILENLFYSLTPPLMQSILPASILKTLYLLLLETLDHPFDTLPFFLKTQWDPEYMVLIAAASIETIKEILEPNILKLKIPSPDLCTSFIQIQEISALGYIYRCKDPKNCALFYNTVQSCLKNWETKLFT